MADISVKLDEKAHRALGLAKAIARRNGAERLDAVHVLLAALRAFPGETATQLARAGLTLAEPVAKAADADDPDADEQKMPVTRELAALVREVGRGGRLVTIEALLAALVRCDSAGVKRMVREVGEKHRATGRRGGCGGARPGAYLSRRDWLADMRLEWRLRAQAARACGQAVCFGDDPDACGNHAAASVIEALERVVASNRSRSAASAAKNDPLFCLGDGLSVTERQICEALVTDALYGLTGHPLGGVSVRSLAQMLAPESYPRNCREVIDAVAGLTQTGFMAVEDDAGVGLTSRVRLANEALSAIIESLADDAISEPELNAMKRELSRDIGDWPIAETA